VAGVYVDVVVTRGGRPLAGLAAADFELKDNGVPQRLELLSAESRPLTAVLVFDTSSSMEGERLEALRSAGAAFVAGLRPEDPAGLVTFSEAIAWRLSPTTDRAAMREALASIRAEGASSVFDALFTAITLSDTGSRPFLVLFSDGEDNTSWLGPRELRALADRSNALVHVVSWQEPPVMVRGRIDLRPIEGEEQRALREIAEATGGRSWQADSPEKLRDAFAAIAEALGHRYILRYEPEGVERAGFHRLEVRLKAGKGDLQVRRGYWVPPAPARPGP
jgi:VWFA-related protein